MMAHSLIRKGLCAACLCSLPLAVVPACAATPQTEPNAVAFTVTDFEVVGDNPLGGKRAAEILHPFVGPQHGIDGLQHAAQALEQALHAAGYALYRVTVPPQSIDDRVRLQVSAATLGKVDIQANRYFDADNVARSLPELRSGQTPNLARLARSIALANQNPARTLAVTMRPAAAPDQVDAQVGVDGRQPYSLMLRADNSGNDMPAASRTSLLLQHANLFGRDHVATAVYTTSPEAPAAVRQYGLFYSVPVYAWGGTLSTYGFHSDVNSGDIQGVYAVRGSGTFYGLDYTQMLLPRGAWRQSLKLGVDDKLFRDQTQFSGTPIGSDVRSRPVTMSYVARYESLASQGSLSLSYVHNLGGGGHAGDADYALVRNGARANWDLWRLQGSYSHRLTDAYSMVVRLTGQHAYQPLIGGEQFGYGGQDSLRGINQRQVLGDSGVQGSVELWGPPLWQNIRLLGFVDAGRVWREQPSVGTPARESAASTGIGLRWSRPDRAELQVDYGHLLNGITGTPSGHSRIDVALTLHI